MHNEFPRPTIHALGLAAAAAAVGASASAITRHIRARQDASASTSGHAPAPVVENNLGCEPDEGVYLDAILLAPDVDGTHQGIAIAMLRDRFSNADDVEPVTADYGDIIRSLIEATVSLALSMARHEFGHECEDPDCEGDNPAFLAMAAGRRMIQFAVSFAREALNHAQECRLCTEAGEAAPGMVRARFCRDIADGLLAADSDEGITVQGLPVVAAFDVASAMVEVIESGYGIDALDQIEELQALLFRAITHHGAPDQA